MEMSRDSLADYAMAIDPDKRRSSGGGQGNEGGFGAGADSGNNSEAGGNTGSGTGGNYGGNTGEAGDGTSANPDKGRNRDGFTGDAESLRNKILWAGEQNSLISLMNSLPGKNGRRWMVFPFSFEEGVRKFEVTMRILLTPEGTAGNSGFRVERMALEIAGENRGLNPSPSRWLFIAENPPGTSGAASSGEKLRLNGSFWPEAAAEKTSVRVIQAMEKELAGLLGIEAGQVQIREGEEYSPFAPDSRDEALPSVNEEA
jgi:hypothetical protein